MFPSDVLEILHDDGGFVCRPCWAVTYRWNETARVDIEERLWLLVGIYLDVLIWNPFCFQRYPYALHEGAMRERLAWIQVDSTSSVCTAGTTYGGRGTVNLPEAASVQL